MKKANESKYIREMKKQGLELQYAKQRSGDKNPRSNKKPLSTRSGLSTPVISELDIHLQEMNVMFNQMHGRMGTVTQLLSIGTALNATVILYITSTLFVQQPMYYLILPLPFLVIALLLLREQYLLMSHDAYWYKRLRLRIVELLPEMTHKNSKVLGPPLGFLSFIMKYKGGRVSRYYELMLSGVRIFLTVPVAIISFWLYYSKHPVLNMTHVSLIVINAFVVLAILFGVLKLFNLNKEVSALADEVEEIGS